MSCVLSQLGAKKGGLGGKKVSKQSFCDLEKKAQAVDKLNEGDTAPTTTKNSPQPAEESMWVSLQFKWALLASRSLIHIIYYSLIFTLLIHFSLSLPPSSGASMRLAYKDLEAQQRSNTEKMKGMGEKKKEQAERLGMGFGSRRWGDWIDGGDKRISLFLNTLFIDVLCRIV